MEILSKYFPTAVGFKRDFLPAPWHYHGEKFFHSQVFFKYF
jgi:hypothetical protein